MQAAPELLEASIVTLVFAMGARGIPEGSSEVVGGPRALLRAVTLRDVVTPLLVMSILSVLHLPAPAAVGLTLLAVSPGPPIGLQRSPEAIARSSQVFLTSMIGVLLSIVSMPFWLAVISKVFIDNASVEPMEVARLASVLFALPLIVGMVLKRLAPGAMRRMQGPLVILANLLLLVATVSLLGDVVPAMRRLGVGFAATAIVLALVALFVGHLAGGRRAADRSAVALLCASRQPALALLIAESNFAGDLVLPAVVASFVIGTAVSCWYAYRQRAQTDARAPQTAMTSADAPFSPDAPLLAPPTR